MIRTRNPVELARLRLRLVVHLGYLRKILFGHKAAESEGSDGWTHPWEQVDALRNYLLLTCFDVLGSKKDYTDFQGWLQTKKPGAARDALDAALAELPDNATALDSCTALHRAYLEAYSTRGAFFRFLHEVLPQEEREVLLKNVSLQVVSLNPVKEVDRIEDPLAKERILYEIRNKFTHTGIGAGSPAGGISEDYDAWYIIDGQPMKGYATIYSRPYGEGRQLNVGARDWPYAPYRAVRAAIMLLDPEGESPPEYKSRRFIEGPSLKQQ